MRNGPPWICMGSAPHESNADIVTDWHPSRLGLGPGPPAVVKEVGNSPSMGMAGNVQPSRTAHFPSCRTRSEATGGSGSRGATSRARRCRGLAGGPRRAGLVDGELVGDKSPGSIGSWVISAGPSIGSGMSRPCQCTVVGSGRSLVTRMGARSPWWAGGGGRAPARWTRTPTPPCRGRCSIASPMPSCRTLQCPACRRDPRRRCRRGVGAKAIQADDDDERDAATVQLASTAAATDVLRVGAARDGALSMESSFTTACRMTGSRAR